MKGPKIFRVNQNFPQKPLNKDNNADKFCPYWEVFGGKSSKTEKETVTKIVLTEIVLTEALLYLAAFLLFHRQYSDTIIEPI